MWRPRRVGGRTELDIEPDQLVWALYARESEDHEGNAEQVGNQLADLRPFVAEIGGRVGGEFAENDTSAFRKVRVRLGDGTHGYRVVRPVWDALMAEMRRGKFNALALPNIDRGMRDPRDLEDLIDLVEHHGVLVLGATGYLDLTTDAGIAMARNEVNQRNLESRNISRRISTGKRRAALKGRNFGGANRPFGWQADKVTVDEEEARHIREAAERIIAGVKARTVASEWNERGIPTVRGRTWTARTVEQIFTNPRLCGIRTYKGEVLQVDGEAVRGVWEAILTDEQFAAVSEMLKSYERVGVRDGRGHATKYLLSPFVRCGKCNARMRGGIRPGPKRAPVHVYWCRDKAEGGCGGCARLGSEVDRYVTALVIADHKRAELQKVEDVPEWDGEQDLADVQEQIQEATAAYRARQISGSRYYPLLEELEAEERKILADKRRHEAVRQSRDGRIADLEHKWADPNFTLEQRQTAIAQSLVAVVIHPLEKVSHKFDPSKIEPIWRRETTSGG